MIASSLAARGVALGFAKKAAVTPTSLYLARQTQRLKSSTSAESAVLGAINNLRQDMDNKFAAMDNKMMAGFGLTMAGFGLTIAFMGLMMSVSRDAFVSEMRAQEKGVISLEKSTANRLSAQDARISSLDLPNKKNSGWFSN